MPTQTKPGKRPRSKPKLGKAELRSQRAAASIRRDGLREERAAQEAQRAQHARERRAAEDAEREREARQRRAAAAARAEQLRNADRRELLMHDLLRRGAGVTQILGEIAAPSDTARDRLRRALQLQKTLQARGTTPREHGGLGMTERRLQRTLTYLGYRVGRLQTEAAG
jgi:hypothetical protein